MIPGYPTHTTYRTICKTDWDVPMCAGPCEKVSALGHRQGRVDRHGTIHWWAADRRASRRGMRVLMNLMALNTHREWWTLPTWKQLWLTNIWSYTALREKYHIMLRMEWTADDRNRAWRLAVADMKRGKAGSLRYTERNFYAWVWRGRYNMSTSGVSKEVG